MFMAWTGWIAGQWNVKCTMCLTLEHSPGFTLRFFTLPMHLFMSRSIISRSLLAVAITLSMPAAFAADAVAAPVQLSIIKTAEAHTLEALTLLRWRLYQARQTAAHRRAGAPPAGHGAV